MDAIVSGHAGVALLLDGKKLSSLRVGEDGIVPRRPSEVPLLLGGARDLRLLRNVGPEQVREQVHLESTRVDALHLALILLDADLSDETRRTAAEELEEELADESIASWLEGVLYAHPPPASADLAGARSACTDSTQHTRALLSRLESLQTAVKEVHEAWQAIPSTRFGTDRDRQNALSAVVRAGLFRSLVIDREAGKPVEAVLFEALKNPALQEVQNSRHVLLDWVTGFRKPGRVGFLVPKPPEPSQKPAEASPVQRRKREVEERRESSAVEGTLVRTLLPLPWESARGISASDLVRRIQEGDPAADEELISRFSIDLSFLLRRWARDSMAAEDLFQETFRLALEKIRKGEVHNADRLPGFLRSLAKNLTIKYLQRASRREVRKEEPEGAAGISEPDAGHLSQLLRQEKAALIRQVLEELSSERDRQILYRFYIAEEDKEQIRSDLGLTGPEFNLVLFRARRRYRELYERHIAKGEE